MPGGGGAGGPFNTTGTWNAFRGIAEVALVDNLIESSPNLDILPANIDLVGAEIELVQIEDWEFQMKNLCGNQKTWAMVQA